MSTLKNELEGFKPEFRSELDNECFKGLAKAFLYGGYISVSDFKEERYRIFIRTVEFYCHYEGDEKDLPKDPIVYHRNGRYVEGEVPYFPLMSGNFIRLYPCRLEYLTFDDIILSFNYLSRTDA